MVIFHSYVSLPEGMMMVDVNLGDACYGHRAGPVGCVEVARKVVNRMMASQQQLATLNPKFFKDGQTPC